MNKAGNNIAATKEHPTTLAIEKTVYLADEKIHWKMECHSGSFAMWKFEELHG